MILHRAEKWCKDHPLALAAIGLTVLWVGLFFMFASVLLFGWIDGWTQKNGNGEGTLVVACIVGFVATGLSTWFWYCVETQIQNNQREIERVRFQERRDRVLHVLEMEEQLGLQHYPLDDDHLVKVRRPAYPSQYLSPRDAYNKDQMSRW